MSKGTPHNLASAVREVAEKESRTSPEKGRAKVRLLLGCSSTLDVPKNEGEGEPLQFPSVQTAWPPGNGAPATWAFSMDHTWYRVFAQVGHSRLVRTVNRTRHRPKNDKQDWMPAVKTHFGVGGVG
ncbi:hypothetical protein BaRGS_00010504 [Batillaria attramentaria]|uniref:Uncharacterized protein n=1 Tax=Batillaria attramentaria TaxID=370345 RepID=A0ABD0LFL9_9CAEN